MSALNDSGYKIVALVRKKSDLSIIKDYKKKSLLKFYDGTYKSIDNIFKKFKIETVIHLASINTYDYKPEDITDIVDANYTLGRIIRVMFLDNKQINGEERPVLDHKKSGDYIIFGARHNFNQGSRADTTLILGRLGSFGGEFEL